MEAWEKLNDEGCFNLIEAIVEQACADYYTALKLQAKNRSTAPNGMLTELRAFFRSEYFGVLCDLDGEEVIEKIESVFEKSYNPQAVHGGGVKKRPIKGTHIKTGEVVIFESVSAAAVELNGSRGAIGCALAGKTANSQGYCWEYLDL